jgi:hypothetical protein
MSTRLQAPISSVGIPQAATSNRWASPGHRKLKEEVPTISGWLVAGPGRPAFSQEGLIRQAHRRDPTRSAWQSETSSADKERFGSIENRW